jgi:hypothetical protein
VPFQQYVETYRYSHFATVYFYACCVRVRSNPSTETHLSKACGLLCRNIFPIVEVPDARQAASDHVYSTFQQRLVSLSPSYPTSLIIIQGLKRIHSVDTSLLWPALCRAHTTQYPPALPLLLHRSITLAQKIQCIRYGAHGITDNAWLSRYMLLQPVTTSNDLDIYFHNCESRCNNCVFFRLFTRVPHWHCIPAICWPWCSGVADSQRKWASCHGEQLDMVFYFISLIAICAHDSDFSASFKSDDVFNGMIELRILNPFPWSPWFSQASHIFRHLPIMFNFDDYGATSSCCLCPIFADLFDQLL